MTDVDNKTIVRRFYEEIVNTGNMADISSDISGEYTEVMDGKRYTVGISGASDHMIGVRKTYPDGNRVRMHIALSAYPKNPPKGMSEGKNPLASRFASVGPLWQRGQRRRSRAGDLFCTAEREDKELFG
jgi:hypothetical protein